MNLISFIDEFSFLLYITRSKLILPHPKMTSIKFTERHIANFIDERDILDFNFRTAKAIVAKIKNELMNPVEELIDGVLVVTQAGPDRIREGSVLAIKLIRTYGLQETYFSNYYATDDMTYTSKETAIIYNMLSPLLAECNNRKRTRNR